MDILGAWVRGWAVSRAVSAPAVATRARTVAEPGTWLKTCGARAAVLAGLTPEWETRETEYLMTFDGGIPPAEVPAGYEVAVRGDGPVWCVAVTSGGDEAAHGRVAVAGGVAVYDRISTEPAHRRRGLGRVVMHRLGGAAGAKSSALLASEAGRGLYGALGWRVASEVVPAHVPEGAR